MEPQIRFCTSADGTRIAYAATGAGAPFVLCCAWGRRVEEEWTHPESRAALQKLAGGRHFIEFDARGVGASQREVEDISLQSLVSDLSAVVDDVGLDSFDLFGGLDGAAVCVAYAAQNPDRVSRLVLWAAYTSGAEAVRPGAVRGLNSLIREDWNMAARAITNSVFPSGPSELQRWYARVTRESMSPEIARKYMDFYTSVDVRPYLREVSAPTLVLHRRGDRDAPIASGREVASLIPNARFVALEGDTGHMLFSDVSYLDTVNEFLGEGRGHVLATTPSEAAQFHTILFTDVEGSTALTQRLGDTKARGLVRKHERITRDALKVHGGSEVKTMGDGFMASFSSATGALECAIALQRAFEARNKGTEDQRNKGKAIRIRIGLNAGEPIAEDDPSGRGDLFGTAVNMAARIPSTYSASPGVEPRRWPTRPDTPRE